MHQEHTNERVTRNSTNRKLEVRDGKLKTRERKSGKKLVELLKNNNQLMMKFQDNTQIINTLKDTNAFQHQSLSNN